MYAYIYLSLYLLPLICCQPLSLSLHVSSCFLQLSTSADGILVIEQLIL